MLTCALCMQPVSKMEYPSGCIPVEDTSSHASDLSQTDADFTTDAADESESEAGSHHPHHRHPHLRHGRLRGPRRHVHYAKLKNSPLSRTQRTGLAHIVEGSGESAADDEGEEQDHESEAASPARADSEPSTPAQPVEQQQTERTDALMKQQSFRERRASIRRRTIKKLAAEDADRSIWKPWFWQWRVWGVS